MNAVVFRKFILSAILFLVCFSVHSQEALIKTDTVLRIGIKHAPPFVTLRDGFSPEGLSIEFWGQVQEDLGRRYEFVVYDDLTSLTSALKKGEVDMSINPITVTEERMRLMDFSQPYFISGTAMVTHEDAILVTMLGLIFSWEFLSVIGSMVVVIGIVGLIMWGVERRRNRGMFHPGVQGIGDGMWWSAVTMTTVGYGDKAPRTKTGRIIGFFWMFAAIVLLSGLTAFITSSLTTSAINDEIKTVSDLKRFKVATVGGSSTAAYLDIFKVEHQSFSDVDGALQALKNGQAEVVVYDRPIMAFYLMRGDYSRLVLSRNNLKTDYYSFTYPQNSPLKNKLDPYIVKVLRSNTWNIKLRLQEGL